MDDFTGLRDYAQITKPDNIVDFLSWSILKPFCVMSSSWNMQHFPQLLPQKITPWLS